MSGIARGIVLAGAAIIIIASIKGVWNVPLPTFVKWAFVGAEIVAAGKIANGVE